MGIGIYAGVCAYPIRYMVISYTLQVSSLATSLHSSVHTYFQIGFAAYVYAARSGVELSRYRQRHLRGQRGVSYDPCPLPLRLIGCWVHGQCDALALRCYRHASSGRVPGGRRRPDETWHASVEPFPRIWAARRCRDLYESCGCGSVIMEEDTAEVHSAQIPVEDAALNFSSRSLRSFRLFLVLSHRSRLVRLFHALYPPPSDKRRKRIVLGHSGEERGWPPRLQ
ncbi:hypothetical protein PENSPDRAFT_355991 [Peniophora sp. CONT]|nr:hypothetical protein PENSPDRAFT_355991 [Peniophora sp. CONT]